MASPRLIAFEGVDGAGKTTVLSIVAEALRQRGEKVHLPREGKEHSSRPTRMIRRLTRDQANFELSPTSELLLYCAREAQVYDELVRPALARGETVLIDRSLITPVVLGSFGRGLDRELCERAALAASGGLFPTDTLIFDVHPRTSRLRKRVEKVRTRPTTESGRKGLAGSGLKQRVRDGYVALAREHHYPVFHAERVSPQRVAERVIAYLLDGARPETTETKDDAIPIWQIDPSLSFTQGLEAMPREVALFLSNGLIAGRPFRERYLEQEPELACWALDAEDPLRERCVHLFPDSALRALSRRPIEGPDDIRLRTLETAPDAAIRALKHVHSPLTDELRERHAEAVPGAVLASLVAREDAFAVALRERLWKQAEPRDRSTSLAACSGDDAWKRREKLFDKEPIEALGTLRGLSCKRTNELLTHFAKFAPKPVIGALAGRSDDVAHELRVALLDTGREVVDSVRGLDDERSWALRERFVESSPSSVIQSLRGTSGPRVAPLRARCERIGAGDLHTARRSQGLDEYEGLPSWCKTSPTLETDE